MVEKNLIKAFVAGKISASLSVLIVQQDMIKKWDGKLPTYGQVPTLFKDVANNK